MVAIESSERIVSLRCVHVEVPRKSCRTRDRSSPTRWPTHRCADARADGHSIHGNTRASASRSAMTPSRRVTAYEVLVEHPLGGPEVGVRVAKVGLEPPLAAIVGSEVDSPYPSGCVGAERRNRVPRPGRLWGLGVSGSPQRRCGRTYRCEHLAVVAQRGNQRRLLGPSRTGVGLEIDRFGVGGEDL